MFVDCIKHWHCIFDLVPNIFHHQISKIVVPSDQLQHNWQEDCPSVAIASIQYCYLNLVSCPREASVSPFSPRAVQKTWLFVYTRDHRLMFLMFGSGFATEEGQLLSYDCNVQQCYRRSLEISWAAFFFLIMYFIFPFHCLWLILLLSPHSCFFSFK